MKTMKLHEGFKKNLYIRITKNLEQIATEANDKRENLEKRLKNHPRRPCTFPTDWHWRNSAVSKLNYYYFSKTFSLSIFVIWLQQLVISVKIKVLPSYWEMAEKMAIHNEVSYLAHSFFQTHFSKINDTEDPCKTFKYVFLKFKQWIETFTKNCRNSRIIGQQQVRKLNKARNKVFQNFANPVCTWN